MTAQRGDASGQASRDLGSDAALVNPDEDQLGRTPFANRIADVLASRLDPRSITVGIYGPWGDGKSSILNFIEARLATKPNVICVRFNPWLYQGTPQLLLAFFATLARALDAKLGRKRQVGKALRALGIALSTVSVGPPGLSLSPGHALERLGDQLATDDVFKQRKNLESVFEGEKKTIVVIIDDVDRLDDEEIATLFKVVKLAADFDHTSYVVAFDPEIVAKALSPRYSNSEEAGTNFLEKIVQVPLEVPRARPEILASMALTSIAAVISDAELGNNDKDLSRFERQFGMNLTKLLKTPRIVKRIINGVAFSIPLIGSEVCVADLVTVESLRVLVPSVVRKLPRERDVLLGRPFDLHIEGAEAYVKACTEDLVAELEPEAGASVVRVLRELFPRIERAFSNYHYNEVDEWTSDRRICSPDYFDRYFAYGIPPGDISDAVMAAYLTSLDKGDLDDATDGLSQLFEVTEAERVIEKLRQSDPQISQGRAVLLTQALSVVGGQLSGSTASGLEAAFSPFGRAAARVSMLVYHLDPPDRAELTIKLVNNPSSIPFAAEVLRGIHAQSQESMKASDRLLNSDALAALTNTFAERLAADDAVQPLFRSFPRQAPMLYQWWAEGTGSETVRQTLTSQCEAHVANSLAFVACFMPDSGGLPFDHFIAGPMYALMTKLIDSEVLVGTLTTAIPILQAEPFPTDRASLTPEERIAMRFVEIHRQLGSSPTQHGAL